MSAATMQQDQWASYRQPVEAVLAPLGTGARFGLSQSEARARLARYGKNELLAEKAVPTWRKFLAQFHDVMAILLLIATAISAGLWHVERDAALPYEAIAICLSAISAISPAGKLFFHSQEGTLNSADVVAFLEHLLREVSGRLVIIWDGAPIHRSHTIQKFLANGAARRLHLERLPAYAPELNPGEGLWHQLKGVELGNLCCVDIPHLRGELRDAVKRVRRKPRILKGCFAGAGL